MQMRARVGRRLASHALDAGAVPERPVTTRSAVGGGG